MMVVVESLRGDRRGFGISPLGRASIYDRASGLGLDGSDAVEKVVVLPHAQFSISHNLLPCRLLWVIPFAFKRGKFRW